MINKKSSNHWRSGDWLYLFEGLSFGVSFRKMMRMRSMAKQTDRNIAQEGTSFIYDRHNRHLQPSSLFHGQKKGFVCGKKIQLLLSVLQIVVLASAGLVLLLQVLPVSFYNRNGVATSHGKNSEPYELFISHKYSGTKDDRRVGVYLKVMAQSNSKDRKTDSNERGYHNQSSLIVESSMKPPQDPMHVNSKSINQTSTGVEKKRDDKNNNHDDEVAKQEKLVNNGKDHHRPCRVIIENKVDFHHEILESIVLQYPLPWGNYNCSSSKPIVYDFALFDNRFPNGMITCPEKKCPKHLNETEFVGWKRYFEGYLQNNTFVRKVDGRKVYYNKLITYDEYESSPFGPPDAVIDATCDIYQRFLVWLTHGKYDNYCVLHRECDFCEQAHYNKSCFLTPMWPDSQCVFLPSDLPKLRADDLVLKEDGDYDPLQTKVCLFGRERNHTMWSDIFLQVPYDKYKVKFVIGSRVYKVKRVYTKSKISPKAMSFVGHEKDYLEFSKQIAKCDILLPATDPIDRPAHFPPSVSGEKSKKKLTGSISQVVGYKLHSVMHHELERIYHDYFTAPVEVYGDSIQSKVEALTKMIMRVSKDKEGQIISP